ncbi:extracellular solute-binding protein [Mesorhizobium sp.]|uniref:extracellular solute-binding protein n=1 Tax=Mesorhizobium sp. TaxID=1871066 RepID=UPI000FEA7ECB|nr:extracellular solute-binding protein [Mesorhizobium sp.]RWP25303.1 MAG: extracellular solute-binding protein [Mesorhizobium sp.]RWQ31993.1 MAG: extracellular solute-binding protein [Mesorhizobium sp.]
MRPGLLFRFLAFQNTLAATFALILAAAISVAFTDSALAQRIALVIGNGKYQSAGTLENPPKDSAAIAEKLRELDFKVTMAIDSDLRGMRASLQAFTEAASSAEIAVIFYAGHAIQVDGENYLIPVDAKIRSRDDLSPSAVRAGEIYESLLKAHPQVTVLILDACRDNPFAKAVKAPAGLASGSGSSAMLVKHPNSGGAIIGFAAAPGAVAYDGGAGNSPYTTALLQWIDRPGLELATMLRRVRSTVVELTRGAQVPWVEEALLREVYMHPSDPAAIAKLESGEKLQVALLDTMRALDNPEEKMAASEFYKRFTGNDQAAHLVIGESAENQQNPDNAFATQALVWLSIRQSRDPEDFRKFLATYPEGPFALLASARLERVEADRFKVASLTNKSGILIVGETSVTAVTPVPSEAMVPGASTDATKALRPPDAPAQPQLPAAKTAPVAGRAEAKVVGPDALGPAASQGQQVAALETDDPLEGEAALGLSRDALSGVQMLLAASGNYSGAIDANFGPRTRGAIAAFQKSAGLADNGYLNRATLQGLTNQYAGKALSGMTHASARAAVHLVAAVASRGPGARPITLRVAAMSRNDQVHAFWNNLAQDFEAAHPGYRAEITHQPDYEYKERLLSMLGSPTPPDIMHTWGGGHLEALRVAGFARDLTKEMSDGWAMEFRPGVLQSFTQDGRIYGVPSSVELVSLWTNKALLEKAGVKREQLATWDGFLRAVRQLRSAGIVPIAIGGRDRWQFQFLYGMLAEQIGGRNAFAKAYAGGSDGFIAQPFVVAGDRLRQLADLDPFQPDFLSVGEGDAGMLFSKGKAAMIVTGNWRLNTMRWNWPGGFDRMKNELLRLELPGTARGVDGAATYGGADGYVINSKAPDLAVELLRVLSSPAVQTRIAELADSVPSVSGADLGVSDPFVREVADTLLRSSYHQLYYDQALGPEAGEVVNDVATRLATGQLGGKEAARQIDRAWQQTLHERSDQPAPIKP